ncbi:MAG: choice-of-anchor J domain-containing protein [Opitutales bacterium]
MTPGVHPDSDIDAPTGVSAAATGEGEITIDFTPDGGNDVVVIFNTTGTFSAPSGTPLIGQALAGGTVLYVGQSSPYIHTGLDAETEYFYSVYTYIDPDYSNAVPVSATTPVAGLLNIEDFEDPGGDTDDWFNAAVSSDDAFEIVTSTGTNSAQIDGSLNPNPDNQYLVSPLLDFSTKSNGVISFEFVGGYDDSDPDSFELVYSTNYSGSGDPESSATWTEIPFDFSTNLEAGDPIALAASGNVSLPPALDGESTVYLAFRYTSDGTLTGSERWLLDNILVTADSASDPLGDYLAARSLVPGDLETDVNTNGFTVLEEYLAGFDDGETFSYGVNPGAGSAGAFTLTSDSASIPDGITVVLRVTNDLLVAPVSTDYTINVTGPDSNGDFTIEFIETYVEGVSPSLTGQRFFFLDITQN